MEKEKNHNSRKSFRICFSAKRLWFGMAFAMLSVLLCGFVGASKIAMAVLPILFLILSLTEVQCSPIAMQIMITIWSIMSTVVIVFASQLLLNEDIFTLGISRILLNMVICGIAIGIVYIIIARIRGSVIIATGVLLFFTAANYFVFKFRGSELCPSDFLSIETAAAVADRYTFSIDAPFVYAVIVAMLFSFVVFCISGYERKYYRYNRLLCGIIISVMAIALILGSKNISSYHFSKMGTAQNGYFLNFVLQIEENFIEKPEGYNKEILCSLEEKYGDRYDNTENTDEFPVVIVIMNESFADLSVLGNDLKTNIEILPFFDSLVDNTIKGYALSSVIGGGTANSEYEVLSGNTMGFLPAGSIVYQQFVKQNPYTIVSYMNKMGYTTIGTHPEKKENWLRFSVYPKMGFDETYFIEDYPCKNLIRGFITDQEMYEQIIKWYEAYPPYTSFFLFGVTMQNHGFYDYEGEDFENTVSLDGYSEKYPDVEQYLTLLRESDNALKNLITYFENVEKEVVILFFGDHLPRLDSRFLEELHGGSFDTLDEQMLQYTVPFFIWANYDIEEQYIELTSLNYLSNLLMKTIGMELPAYNNFLEDVQKVIPAMNSFGYYSKEQGRFLPYSEAMGIEEEMLKKYRMLQYNCIFDDIEKSKRFFPSYLD